MKPTRNVISPRSPGGDAPLSFAQQRLWLLDQLEPAPWSYNVVVARRLRGPLRVDALQRALDELLVRHESLRTTFPVVDGEPVQRIGTVFAFPLAPIDLTDPGGTGPAVIAAADAELRRPFDLAVGPLFRGVLLRIARDDHVLVLTMHHIVTDAWSEAVLLAELGQLYTAFTRGDASPLVPLPIQYADVAVWQREMMQGAVRRGHLDYWLQQLCDLPPSPEVAGDRPRPLHRSGRGGIVELEIPAALTEALRRLTRTARATMFMTLLAGFQSLLSRYSAGDDIAVGTAIANRPRLETEGLIGFFANTLVLRTDVSGTPSYVDVIARVREVALGAYRHQDLPFELLVKALQPERTPGQMPLFQHMFVFQNTPAHDLVFDGIDTEPFAVAHDTAMFDLTLTLTEGRDTIVGTLEYALDLYDEPTARRIARHFRNLLEAAVAEPDVPVAELDLLDDAERNRIVVDWNRTTTDFPDCCVHELFETRAAAHPDAIALSEGEATLTYAELDARADLLARRLRRRGIGPESRVGICLHRSIDAIVALLATLKAGGAYVALDPDYPPERLAFMVEDSGVEVVVTRVALQDRVAPLWIDMVGIDVVDEPWGERPDDSRPGVAPHNLALVVYTSGSTGEPKGVMIEHRSVVALVFGVDYVDFDDVDSMLHMAPLAFDASTFEIWGALLHGRRCVIAPHRPFELAGLAEVLASGVDTAWLTAAVFNLVVDEDWRMLRTVRQLVVGGEALSVDHVARALELLPGLRLVNGYGPTETTTFAVCHEIGSLAPDADRVPIGRPIGNTRAYVLDPVQQPVPIGVAGELCIGGSRVARGYLDRPDLTARRFVVDPFCDDPGARLYRTGDLAHYRADGEIEFLGRFDDQIKIRGFRVEPGEVEAALTALPSVAIAAVLARTDERGDHRLVAYVVARAPAVPTPSELRDRLRDRLPAHLVPDAFVVIGSLPLTTNGKVDRNALAALDAPAEPDTPYVDPGTPTEAVLAALWAEILGVERVGIDDNFFSAGGHSLLAAALTARTTRRTGKTIPLSLFFDAPTIRAVAAALDSDDAGEDTTVVSLRTGGTKRPLFLAHGVNGDLFRYLQLVRWLDAERPVFGFRPTKSLIDPVRRPRIPELAERYVADLLRMQPGGPYLMAGFSYGGIVVVEIAHQLEELGHRVDLLALLDAEPTSAIPASRARRELHQIGRLLRRGESFVAYARRRSANARTKVRRAPWLVEHWFHTRTGRPLPERWDDVERVHVLQASPVWRSLSQALSEYVSPVTTCPITLFRAGSPTAPESAVRIVDRDAESARSYVIDGPGVSHETIMSEPHVQSLARALADALDGVSRDEELHP